MSTYKNASFEKCINAPVVNLKELRKIAWNGIPPIYRAITWKLLLGYVPTNNLRRSTCVKRRRDDYKKSVEQHFLVKDNIRTAHDRHILEEVSKDAPRTAPQLEIFSNKRMQNSIERILFLWAIRHPASSYVQGINDLVTPFLAVFLGEYYGGRDITVDDVYNTSDDILLQVEADCYGCLCKLLSGIQDHYTPDQPGIHRMVIQLETLVKKIDNDLYLHFNRTGLKFVWFSFKWMNCYLMREFSLSCTIRMWDTYLSEDKDGFDEFHVYVCAALLGHFSKTLKEMDFENLFEFIQNMPTLKWGETEIEIILSKAYVLQTLYGGK